MFSALYNPITLNTTDDLNKAFDSGTHRTKYVAGSVIYLEEIITSPNDSSSQTRAMGEYMWVEVSDNFSAGVPGMIVPGGYQAEAIFDTLEAATAGQKIAFPTIDVSAGEFTWVKLSGHITVAANVNVVSGNYVKISRGNSNVEQGNTSGTVFDEEALGVATTSTSGGESIIVINAGRTVKVA
ncbi:hypothetical protein CL622_07405 [archaeon]|nr:hypothetical protein [archaeon]|tara:strand:+ start:123 stop:671 length:549 start_codon:yes stop_codon:yes gene_type:complete